MFSWTRFLKNDPKIQQMKGICQTHSNQQMERICQTQFSTNGQNLSNPFKSTNVGKRANFHKIPCFTSPRHGSFNWIEWIEWIEWSERSEPAGHSSHSSHSATNKAITKWPNRLRAQSAYQVAHIWAMVFFQFFPKTSKNNENILKNSRFDSFYFFSTIFLGPGC